VDQWAVGDSGISAFKGCLPKQNKGNKDGLLHGLIHGALGLPGGFFGW